MSVLLLIAAVVAFAFAIFAPVGPFGYQELIAFGLAALAAALLPLGDWVKRA